MTLIPHHGTMKHLKTRPLPSHVLRAKQNYFYVRTCLYKNILKEREGTKLCINLNRCSINTSFPLKQLIPLQFTYFSTY